LGIDFWVFGLDLPLKGLNYSGNPRRPEKESFAAAATGALLFRPSESQLPREAEIPETENNRRRHA